MHTTARWAVSSAKSAVFMWQCGASRVIGAAALSSGMQVSKNLRVTPCLRRSPIAGDVAACANVQHRLCSAQGNGAGGLPSNSDGSEVQATGGVVERGKTAADGSAPPTEEALENLLEEIQVMLSRPVPIGALFRALSSSSKKTLVRNKLPLEQLLLRYPENFVVYQQGSLRNRTIYCAPPHLVPDNVRRMVLETPSCMAPQSAGSLSANTVPEDINARILQHDPISEKQQRINTVLQYIPNEWSPFTELGIPEEVRVKCMGKPSLKASEFFEKYPQYFEIRQQGLADHTFYVRRSMALQRSQQSRQRH
ncbi:hypothetical protein TRVL_07823 [Trypanosoma vivax]|nr:hypothetical protein TRVL_07823 [Trypanosoma vivax]